MHPSDVQGRPTALDWLFFAFWITLAVLLALAGLTAPAKATPAPKPKPLSIRPGVYILHWGAFGVAAGYHARYYLQLRDDGSFRYRPSHVAGGSLFRCEGSYRWDRSLRTLDFIERYPSSPPQSPWTTWSAALDGDLKGTAVYSCGKYRVQFERTSVAPLAFPQ